MYRTMLSAGALALAVSFASCTSRDTPQIAESADLTTGLSRLRQTADSLSQAGAYSAATVPWRKISDQFGKAGNWVGQLDAEAELGRNLLLAGQFEMARQRIDSVISLAIDRIDNSEPALGKAYGVLGEAHARLGIHDEAIRIQRNALELLQQGLGTHNPLVADAFHQVGLAYHEANQLAPALSAYRNSLAIRERVGESRSLRTAATYNNVANIYWTWGEYDLAERFHALAIDIKLSILPPDHPDVASSLDNLGNVYVDANDYSAALPLLRKSLDIRRRFLGDHLWVGFSLNNYGTGLMALGRLHESIPLFQESLALEQKFGNPRGAYVGDVMASLGAALISIGSAGRGIAYLDSSITIYRESRSPHLTSALLKKYEYLDSPRGRDCRLAREAVRSARTSLPPAHPFHVQALNALAECSLQNGRFELARTLIDSAFAANSLPVVAERTGASPGLNARSYWNLLESLMIETRFLLTPGACKGDVPACKNDALNSILTAASVIDRMRESAISRSAKLRLVDRTAFVYDSGFLLAQSLYEQTRSRNYQEIAFMLAERRRARALLDRLPDRQPPDSASEATVALGELRLLQRRISFAERQMEGVLANDRELEIELADRLIGLRNEYRSLQAKLAVESPSALAFRFDGSTTTLQELQEDVITSGKALLSYSVVGDSIVVFGVTRDTLFSQLLVPTFLLKEEISRLRRAIWAMDRKLFVSTAQVLGRTLVQSLPPVLEGLDLLIVPDPAMVGLPFEVLLTSEAPEDADWDALPYLTHRHAIAYSYSVDLLKRTRSAGPTTSPRKLLAVAPLYDQAITVSADSTENGRDPVYLPAIPQTLAEVQAIARLAEGPQSALPSFSDASTTMILGDDATEERLKDLPWHDYSHIHIASHAFAPSKSGSEGGIYLYPPSSTSSEDGVLKTGEVLDLNLDAELLSLSACDTGIGTINPGEGLVSLSTEFMAAGARNLLVSLWPSEDEAASFVMAHFYEQIFDGMERPAALRLAKEKQISLGGERAAPIYWAPFVLIGS